MAPLNIAVIGGSIAGCTIAQGLLRDGHKVSVFERATSELEDRGAGIVVPVPLLDTLRSLGMVDTLPAVSLARMTYRVRNTNGRGTEKVRTIWKQSTQALALRWGHLHRELRRAIPANSYHTGMAVHAIEPPVDSGRDLQLTLSNGSQTTAELVIAADGIFSSARELVAPGVKPRYSGYVLWRGIADDPARAQALEDNVLWHPFNGGLAGCYPIASADASQRVVNWGIYDRIEPLTLKRIFPDFDAARPMPFALTGEARAYLYQLAGRNLPASIAELVHATPAPFLQPIADVAAKRLVDRRIVLLGDAATVLRPHTAAGAVKAINSALALRRHIASSKDTSINLEQALASWEREQLAEQGPQVELSEALGRGWILEAPQWQRMTKTTMDDWYASVTEGRAWYMTTPEGSR